MFSSFSKYISQPKVWTYLSYLDDEKHRSKERCENLMIQPKHLV